MDDVVSKTKSQMDRAIEHLSREFGAIRTGRANPQILEQVEIDAYEGAPPMRLIELATINTQDSKTLVVTPFDPSVVEKIERGIRSADLGFSPVVDDKILRINIPPLTEERRKELVKVINEKAEQGKVSVRQARHEGMENIKEESDSISEDEVHRIEGEIQKLTDEYNKKVDDMREAKEKELMAL